ncbi:MULTISPECIES: hypothetical protein [unclassified Pseudoalteromonas]|uniref:hypothetical protein n=1 Tax=unclassified Pseudoalteromonas TaxID=194690 RepID=UPI00235816F6|nr:MULTISPECIES: hypothetical protein [unclassified Pseudoalteromonas]MDC9563412.1 hypothetical protein [Pseudoalteromonas sp. GAB2316C]MDC9572106.1 hypothetical protein [Pseudoalteromonas sp. GABNS16A]MDC9583859.1 hypothetical protein [Pseudoalteromonas sp. GABNS16C]MDC9607744.1 hypothetical protein [Pseudoalteromonas sp. GABNS16H]
MLKKLIFTSILCISMSGCDSLLTDEEQKATKLQFVDIREQDFKKISGHWVHNPAKCDKKIKIYGLLEYTFSENGLSVGGAQSPMTGTLTSKRVSPEIKESFSNMTNCDGVKIELDKHAKHLQFKSKNYALSFIVNGANVWALKDNDEPILLERFENVKFKDLEIIEPTEQEMQTL